MKFTPIALACFSAALLLSPSAQAAKASFNADQKTEIETIIHDYLKNKPEIILEAVQELQKKQAEQAKQVIQDTHDSAAKFADQLFRNTNDPVLGNPSGSVTVVEFFDYQCGHCMVMNPVLEELVKTNKDVRLVLKQLPIRGPASILASKAALAAQKQNKYQALHNELFAVNQPLTEELIYKAALKAGLNLTQLKKDMNDQQIEDALKANDQLARDLKLIGTPAIFIAKTDVKTNSGKVEYIPGRAEKTDLEQAIKKAGSA